MTMAVPGAKLAKNPYQMDQEMIEKLGTKPKNISASGKDGIMVEVRNQVQSERMAKKLPLAVNNVEFRSIRSTMELKGSYI